MDRWSQHVSVKILVTLVLPLSKFLVTFNSRKEPGRNVPESPKSDRHTHDRGSKSRGELSHQHKANKQPERGLETFLPWVKSDLLPFCESSPVGLHVSTRNIWTPLFKSAQESGLAPEFLIHWGHAGAMATVLLAMGGYGTFLGWSTRLGNGSTVYPLSLGQTAAALHPQLMGLALFLFFLGGQGGTEFRKHWEFPVEMLRFGNGDCGFCQRSTIED